MTHSEWELAVADLCERMLALAVTGASRKPLQDSLRTLLTREPKDDKEEGAK